MYARCACPFGSFSFWISCLLFHLSAHYASYISAPALAAVYGFQVPCVWQSPPPSLYCVLSEQIEIKICGRRRFRQNRLKLMYRKHACAGNVEQKRLQTMAIKRAHFVFCFVFLFTRACIDCCVPLFFIDTSCARLVHVAFDI